MSYWQRLSFFIILDSCIVLTALVISEFLVRADIMLFSMPTILSSLAILLGYFLSSMKLKLYKKAWEYASIGELVIIFKVVSLSILPALLLQQIFVQDIYARLLAVTWLLEMMLIGGSRFVWRLYRDSILLKPTDKKKTLIIGAGSAGTMVARQLLKNKTSDLLPVAFIDDNAKKHQLDILGIPVIGGVKQIEHIVKELKIENIIISIPSLSRKELNIIFQECAKTKANTKILPMLEDLVTGKVSVSQFRDVRVEDLLGRDPVDMNMESITDCVANKVVLVTGAGGSIGSEISRQVAQFSPSQIILLGHGENSIYAIELELKESFKNNPVDFVTEIADVQDAQKMMVLTKKYKPDVIYHAAAHKHVPLMERNPEEAVKNNIIGTMNIARAAEWNSVKTFVMVSTDKAVNPTSVMGASKKLAEMIIQGMDKSSKTKFVAVRFGNVLGSRGSVIPLFKKQIEKGGPVTITHPDMVRYFMTIPEASRLVMQAGALANGGEVFVLDMGDPVRIVDLAKNLIKLSGNTLEEIGLEFTGVRPGEKLFEELLKAEEVHDRQIYPKIYIGKTATLYLPEIEEIIATFADLDRDTLKEKLLNLANRNNNIMHSKQVMSVSS
ncbi:nucleoside-diphosphate sugar epimerase/dehydratase [Lentibacillus sp. Marseille-P4043]|uniref:nucleoside-diphosphate sugar epimerase/dehydratase n=1 Tax=Lentibacillus sp. Marseille-P4043 TaxID=2040293 RepID=UPI000D0B2CBB|nr:nucleoside-diphosphate sugar epimerase/dehydratase [Lentibacillus sp. Marseille-P4043]